MTRVVPQATTRRLSLYLRALATMQAASVETVSSRGLAEACSLNPAQVRKDLARFGEFGVRGVGYEVERLRAELEAILGLDRSSAVVIVGGGNLGSALADYPGFVAGGFRIVAVFDVQDDKVGTRTRSGLRIEHFDTLEDVVRRAAPSIGIVAVPAASAQPVVDRLVAAGVRAILNFAPTRPRVPAGVALRHVDLSVELESLSFFLAGGRTREG